MSPPDEVLDLLYRGGEPRDLGATVRQWDDLAAMNERAFRGSPRHRGPAASATFWTRWPAGRR